MQYHHKIYKTYHFVVLILIAIIAQLSKSASAASEAGLVTSYPPIIRQLVRHTHAPFIVASCNRSDNV